jgi:Cu2+-exporting ATPase
LSIQAGFGGAAAVCRHCGTTLALGGASEFCCTGCELVYALIREQSLERYYELRDGQGLPIATSTKGRDRKWLEPIEEGRAQGRGLSRVDLDVQGLHCTGCVWLIEEMFRRDGGARVIVNPSLGKMTLAIGPSFPLGKFVEEVERFGYLVGPSLKSSESASNGLLVRLGVCAALSMNSMSFALALYTGASEPFVVQLFHRLNFGLSALAVLVGGTVFIGSAARALRRGVLHVDLPIAMGIVLAFGSSTWTFLTRGGASTYFDTINVFITLMLLGRFLQERVLEKNRRALLASDGVDAIWTRRIEEKGVALVRCGDLKAGDRLLVAPGDLVPVDAVLEDREASCSLDWINGEAEPQRFEVGKVVPAGAFLVSSAAIVVLAKTDFSASPLRDLLRTPVIRTADEARATSWWRVFVQYYVAAVLVVAVATVAGWWLVTRDASRALEVVTAVLIVTCPCAFGIAVPLGYEMVQAGLRREGLFVRSPGFLDRALSVTRVVFDKTGTITTGALELENPHVVDGLSSEARTVLYNLVARSTHPKSAAISAALEGISPPFLTSLEVHEVAGRGVEVVHEGRKWRLGAPGFAGGDPTAQADVVFAVDGAVLASFVTHERIRPDAAAEVRALQRDGLDVWILSGDAQERVHAVSASVGVARDHVVAERTAQQKSAWLTEHDRKDTLMVGDGINDSLVVGDAWCSGTPAVDRPFMPARADFYFVTAGLRPIRIALRAGRRLARVVRLNLVIAVAYNVVTVGLAVAGRMSPVLCAVLMPLSSLTTIGATVLSLSKRSATWKL